MLGTLMYLVHLVLGMIFGGQNFFSKLSVLLFGCPPVALLFTCGTNISVCSDILELFIWLCGAVGQNAGTLM